MAWFDNGFPTYFAMLWDGPVQPGYPALLLLSFLASTLLPLGSEWLLVLMLVKGYDPLTTVAVATVGNTAGACTTWLVGRYGGTWLMSRFFRISDGQHRRAEAWYRRYGSASLLFSWLPVIGDPLCLVGGLLNIRFIPFLALAGSGKLLRYALLAGATLGISA